MLCCWGENQHSKVAIPDWCGYLLQGLSDALKAASRDLSAAHSAGAAKSGALQSDLDAASAAVISLKVSSVRAQNLKNPDLHLHLAINAAAAQSGGSQSDLGASNAAVISLKVSKGKSHIAHQACAVSKLCATAAAKSGALQSGFDASNISLKVALLEQLRSLQVVVLEGLQAVHSRAYTARSVTWRAVM